jgi:hypothetical protein
MPQVFAAVETQNDPLRGYLTRIKWEHRQNNRIKTMVFTPAGNLAKVGVVSSNLIARSNIGKPE